MKKKTGGGVVAKQIIRKKAGKDAAKAQGPLGQILRHAIQVGATDVHLERGDNLFRVRYRISGNLREEGPKLTRASCVSAISTAKRLAGMKPEKTNVPQSGRIEWEVGTRDFLVSAAPCAGGESVVLRHLSRPDLFKNLDVLGIEEHTVATLRRWLGRPHGVVIVSGLAGSGKATMFYALLQELNTSAVKIVTLEEPVWYRIDGINHLEVDARQGVDLATAFQCAQAQDPDVIAVGELKNAETANAVFRAAMSGHMSMSVMHGEDGAATVERLRRLGVEPALISRTLIGVLAQRLVRKICDKCKVARKPTATERTALPRSKASDRFYRGKGCAQCGGTGYRGRAPVFELFELDDKIKTLILRDASEEDLRQQARKSGIVSLRDAALAKAKAGVTTLSQALT